MLWFCYDGNYNLFFSVKIASVVVPKNKLIFVKGKKNIYKISEIEDCYCGIIFWTENLCVTDSWTIPDASESNGETSG
jgi:hypothetical protein